jgi:hypothetical protein
MASACWNSIGSSVKLLSRDVEHWRVEVGRDQARRRRQQVAQAPCDYAGSGAGL